MSTYVVEYGKGQAKCKGACKGSIPKGDLRFGVMAAPTGEREYGISSYRHFPACMTAKVAKNAIAAHGSADQIPGVANLKEEDRKAVVEKLNELVEGQEGKKKATGGGKRAKADTEGEGDQAEGGPSKAAKKGEKETATGAKAAKGGKGKGGKEEGAKPRGRPKKQAKEEEEEEAEEEEGEEEGEGEAHGEGGDDTGGAVAGAKGKDQLQQEGQQKKKQEEEKAQPKGAAKGKKQAAAAEEVEEEAGDA